jgi:hypothetical protein
MWTPPITWGFNDVVTSAQFNEQIRDNLIALHDEILALQDMPRVSVYSNAALSVPASTDTAVTFDSVLFDSSAGAMWDISDPTKLVAPDDGTYLFGGSFMWAQNSVGWRRFFFRDSNIYTYSPEYRATNNASDATAMNGTGLAALEAGDYVEMHVEHNSSTNPLASVVGLQVAMWMRKIDILPAINSL